MLKSQVIPHLHFASGSAKQKGLRLDAVSAASAFASCQTEQQWKAHGEAVGVPPMAPWVTALHCLFLRPWFWNLILINYWGGPCLRVCIFLVQNRHLLCDVCIHM